jgi:hypothetical protein
MFQHANDYKGDCIYNVINPYKNAMNDVFLINKTIHKEILQKSISVEEARKKLNIISDFNEHEAIWIKKSTIWGDQKYIPQDSIMDEANSFFDLKKSLLSFDTKKDTTIVSNGTEIYESLKKKKINRPVNDYTVSNCFCCNLSFGFFNRKHHCRACGRIFCQECSKWYEIIPEAMIGYECIENWITPNAASRVCLQCKKSIQLYYELENLIFYFEVMGYTVYECLKAATICKMWKEAVCIYLSNCRDIQNQPMTQKLTQKQKTFLLANKDLFLGHSCWNMQLLKLGFCVYRELHQGEQDIFLGSYNEENKSSCYEIMCNKNCNKSFSKYDCLILLNSPCFDIKTKEYALECLEYIFMWENIAPFLPIEIEVVQNFILKNSDLFSMFFWESRINAKKSASIDIFKNRLLANNAAYADTIQETLLFIALLESPYESLYALSQDIVKLKVPFTGPFGIIDRFDHTISIKKSATSPMVIHYYEGSIKKGILYKREDLRKDFLMVNIVKVLYSICEETIFRIGVEEPFLPPFRPDKEEVCFDYGSPYITNRVMQDEKYIPFRFLATYRVCPVDEKSGFIEIVPKSNTLYSILSKGTISNYLYTSNPTKKICTIMSNYSASLAFWTVVTYILGIGDRHMENIMIRTDGVLFHIDYGFIFGDDSTINSSIATINSSTSNGLVRLDEAMIEGLGGPEMFFPFKEKCSEIFCVLRTQYHFLCACLYRFIFSEPRILDEKINCEFIEGFLKDRLLIGQGDREAKDAFDIVIESSRGTLKNKVSDVIHNNVMWMKEKFFG